MNIVRNVDKGIVTVTAVNEQEVAILKEIAATKKSGDLLQYRGRRGADPNDPDDQRMILSFQLNEQKFDLTSSSDTHEPDIRFIRDAIFFGGYGLILISCEEVDGVLTLVFTVNRCKICKGPMASMGECEHKTCNACKDKCEHTYIRGAVHGGEYRELGVGEYCDKCGRAKPTEGPKVDEIKHVMNAEK